MATGADKNYWARRALPSVFKHALLDRYVPPFAGMTGSKAVGRRVVFLDGYAGQGRYDNGDAGSAEKILKMATAQKAAAGLSWTCFFVEQDKTSAASLHDVVAEYAAQGVQAYDHRGDVLDVLDQVVQTAAGCPLFAFLDPCGLGLPFQNLTELLCGPRKPDWPPTEVLLNFSLDAVRRIGGHVLSPHGNETTLERMDAAVGGDWWRAHFQSGVTDAAVTAVRAGFADRLERATGMYVVPVPVRRAPGHKPIYDLMFGTRSPYGLWVFGDAVARSTQAWWDTLEEVEAEEDPDALFGLAATFRPRLEDVELAATPVIAASLTHLLTKYPNGFDVVQHTLEVFGDYYGQVRETVVRKAIKQLHRDGGTASDGVGGKTRDLTVLPPAVTPAR